MNNIPKVRNDPAHEDATVQIGVSSGNATSELNLSSLLDCETVALNIVSHLSVRDTLQLQCVDKQWRDLVANHDKYIFSKHLCQDFYEGKMLVDTVTKRGMSSYKRMYLAFQKRWKLQEHLSDENLAFHWRRPFRRQSTRNPSRLSSPDVNALVFIVRVGNDPDSCGRMQWEQDNADLDSLVLDEEWYYDYEESGLDFPALDRNVCRLLDAWQSGLDVQFSDITNTIKSKYRLTLHVVDVQKCQVMTLMEESPAFEILPGDIINTNCHGDVNLYGLPPPESPFHIPLENVGTRRDWNFDNYENVESVNFSGFMNLLRLGEHDDENDDTVYCDGHSGVNIFFDSDFSSLKKRDDICNFFRALMKEKCHRGWEPAGESDAAIVFVEQPMWVQTEKILDLVISFASFELQAGRLRLVCRQFKDSAIRQLEAKLLDETKVIGFDRDYAGWFKADVRRGWSDEQFGTDRGSVIDDALWMASCRCCPFGPNHCTDKKSCPSTKMPLKFGRENTVLDMEQARELLNKKGWVKLTPNFPSGQGEVRRLKQSEQHVKIRFQKGEKSIFKICDAVSRAIRSEVQYRLMPDSFRRFYGISGQMTSRRFLRSIFLVFCNSANSAIDTEEDRLSKRRCLPEPSIGFAKSVVDGSNSDRYCRSKTLYRFYTSSHEPIEIRLESRHMFS